MAAGRGRNPLCVFAFLCSHICFDPLGRLFDLERNSAKSSRLQIEASLNGPHC